MGCLYFNTLVQARLQHGVVQQSRMDITRTPKLIDNPRDCRWVPLDQLFQLLLDGTMIHQPLALRVIETVIIPRPGKG